MKKILGIILSFCLLFLLTNCGAEKEGRETDEFSAIDPTELSRQLTYKNAMELSYAKEFTVNYYENNFTLISITDGSHFLLVPEGNEAPDDLPEEVTLLYQPLDQIYLVASAVMDMFASIDGIDLLRFSALQEENWYVEEAKTAMKTGRLLYAGKYSTPDYELILAEGCDLAIENTMILHTPEVKEQLEKFGIPVLVDYSSYEKTPQGRMEWVKLYGLLAGKETEAEQVFEEQVKEIESVSSDGESGKTVAFFYITTSGGVNVRKSSDYLPKMIDLAGGTYIFRDLGDEDNMASSTMTMQMEDFYAAAQNADYLIYNSAIEGELTSVEDIIEKNPIMKKFKAVKEDHVYCTTKNLYQSSMELGTMISDIHKMLNDETGTMTYLFKLE